MSEERKPQPRTLFNIKEYFLKHKRAPKGDQIWRFSPSDPQKDPRYTDRAFAVTGTYDYAKREAAKIAKLRGYAVLFICC